MPRIGMIVPSSNTCLEPVTCQLLASAGDVSAHFTRIRVTRIALDDGASAQFDLQPMRQAASLLADAGVDAIAWNGTSGSWLGPAEDQELTAAITKATGVAATTSTLALLAACRVFGVRQLGVITPYTADVGDQITATYQAQGLSVPVAEHFGITDNLAFAAVPAERVIAAARTAAASADALAIVCTNVPGASLAAGLERELGIPVLDSVTATFWHALETAGSPRCIGGWGALLATGSMRARAQQICADLMAATGCDRVTLRLDLPSSGLHVNLPTAEAARPGVASILREASLDQRRLNTVVWLEQARRNLVQPDFKADPRPPAALIDVYGVQAQMLGPVERGKAMVGWLSAHSLRERSWSPADQAALVTARAQAGALVSDTSRD